MPALTIDQVLMLDSYNVYTTMPARTLFTLERVHKEFFQEDEFADLMMGITNARSKTAAISHFSKRYGQFVAMQFYMLSAYDEIWDGSDRDLQFDATKENGLYTICMFASPNDWRYVEDLEREHVMSTILYNQCYQIVQDLRNTTSISPRVIWDNFFVHIVNVYAKLLDDPQLADQAMADLEILESTEVWSRLSEKSLFYEYTKGRTPASLVNQPIRRSCCLSKDIPGLGACGYCPLERD
ncbi:Fe-S oxidoreductase [Rummeliibacillus suwonensis]|uniref:Fe-S oxidoreductase n=1 Tax=Rummeliibacillus suwonensis TaxID=1306154 RepID=UPI001AAFD380|nr:Fe-S oxidoreductase [Rummeliibacillus suwonensis]MBO2535264.1 Fe-S oxidoreductase [Rummeliibacillus suwonensis]